MEYRRRKRRSKGRAQASRRTAQQAGSAGRAVIALLLAAAIIYIVSASAAGTWIAQNVMAPIFDAFSPDATHGTGSTPEPGTSPGPSVSDEITLPAMNCYMLQMGIYSSMENAKSHSESLQGQGAGGYILQDGDRYRVLAAGYDTEANAKEVRDRLKDEGLDCTVHEVSCTSASLRVTSTQAQLDKVKAGFEALVQMQKRMTETALTFDKQQQTISDGKKIVTEIRTNLENATSILNEQSTTSGDVLSLVKACYDNCLTALKELESLNTESFVTFSARFKYTQIQVTHEYVKLVGSLTA